MDFSFNNCVFLSAESCLHVLVRLLIGDFTSGSASLTKRAMMSAKFRLIVARFGWNHPHPLGSSRYSGSQQDFAANDWKTEKTTNLFCPALGLHYLCSYNSLKKEVFMARLYWSRFFFTLLCLCMFIPAKAEKNKGELKNLVCFVRFLGEEDNSDSFEMTFSAYEQIFNDATPGANSVYNYFREASYGQLSWTSTFFPAPEGPSIAIFIIDTLYYKTEIFSNVFPSLTEVIRINYIFRLCLWRKYTP